MAKNPVKRPAQYRLVEWSDEWRPLPCGGGTHVDAWISSAARPWGRAIKIMEWMRARGRTFTFVKRVHDA